MRQPLYEEVVDNYRDHLIEKFGVGKRTEAQTAYYLGKLDEWEYENDRKEGLYYAE